jgi:tRNA dimethylallyltransferase
MESLRAGQPLVVIVGPTAAGKSALAIFLAERLGGEVLNCDSVQVYRGLDVGSGKVSLAERRGVPHHLLDAVEPEEAFTAGDYRRRALRVLGEVNGRGRLPIVVGGTGLYLRALLEGLFAGPERSPQLRERLRRMAERRGREFPHRLLSRLDPLTAARIHLRDAQKVIRALEVCLLTRRPMSEQLAQGREGLRGFHAVKLGLRPPRKELAARIDARVERMFLEGLVEEARVALERAGGAPLPPLGALGYRQACAVLRGEMSLEEAVRRAQTATRQYAKRQMTWFRREPGVTWFEGFGDDPAAQAEVFAWLGRVLPRERSSAPGGRHAGR